MTNTRSIATVRLLSVLLVFILMLTLAACGGSNPPSATTSPPSGTASPVASATPEETPTEDGTASPVASATPEETPTEGGTDEIVPGKRVDRVINPSELLSAEDATQIFGKEFISYEQDVGSGLSMSTLLCRYGNYDEVTNSEINFTFTIMQDATLKETGRDKDLADAGGITGYNQTLKQKLDTENATPVEGVGEWAFIRESSNGKSFSFAYGAYNVDIVLEIFGDASNGEGDAWLEEKLTEAGKLIVERLAAIIG